jgi:RNA polymerase sigma-70 factor (ECF subfamily)
MDRNQVRSLYEKHSRGLFAYACSFSNSFASAEDSVHQVFVRLLRLDLQVPDSPVPYLYRAVRNAVLNQNRNRGREVDLEDLWLETTAGTTHAGIELQSTLQELPSEQREVIILHIWGQLSFEEIGDALEISSNTAASRYRYGLRKLRQQFQVVSKDR